MSLNNPVGGIGYAAEFQSSALPFLTSSIALQNTSTRIDFPKVTRFICIANHESTGKYLKFGFTKNGVELGNYFLLDGGQQTQNLELRVTSLHLMGSSSAVSFSMLAGLTNIDARQMPILSGSFPDGSPAWLGVG